MDEPGLNNSNSSTFRMKNLLIGIIIFIVAGFPPVASGAQVSSAGEDLLELLDNELSRRDEYAARRQHKIDSVKTLIAKDSTCVASHYLELGELQGGLNADSAIVTFSRGLDVALADNDSVLAQRFMIERVTELRKLNSIPEAIKDMIAVSRFGIFPENSILFHEICRDLYYTMAEIFEETAMHESYINPRLEHARALQAELPADSYSAKINLALMYFAQGNDAMFFANLAEIANEIPENDTHYSIALTSLGGRHFLYGHHDEAISYLAKATLSEIRAGDRHGTALIRLGMTLYENGDLARAHNYLSIALEEALAGGAKTNCVMISEALMPVSQALRKQERATFIMLVVLVVCLCGVALLLWNFYRGKRRRTRELERIKQQLVKANQSKEAYISEFMNLSSSYMEGLEELNRITKRKIAAGQVDDLLNLIKSGKMVEEQRRKFDDIFDEAFLAIYPSFIDDVNALLLPEKRIVTPSRNVLTTELRVLAFTRLGIDDTAKVARFLGVTLNTVYTYRNKLRNKALSRDTFDADVMKIGLIA